ncbi:MAG: biotin transporter BioY [Lachnospiraceae bacterium]|nr:biotin transporter BioY [Lachnospiraceae bacterium]
MNKTLQLTLAAMFVALMIVGARIGVPLPGISEDYFTLQFLVALMAGLLLGSKLGAISMGAYLALGLIGVPVFAAGGGLAYVVRASFGYLVGFAATAFAVGFIVEKTKTNSIKGYWLACVCGLIVCYGIGLPYEYVITKYFAGNSNVAMLAIFLDCFPIDFPGDCILTVIGAALAYRLRPVLLREGQIPGRA